jgi:hypothetical protein
VEARQVDVKPPRTLSRTSNYLDALATALRDLGGPTTIPHELTQNADDAGNATTIRFTISNDDLTVWNDGTFTDCRDDGDECPWPVRCDLHGFRKFAGRNKESDPTRTGAFGVGFTSVYGITDRPELLYEDQHWVINEAAAENERLRSCGGNCGRTHGRPGTTFILPWARSRSPLRDKLSVPPVTDEAIADLEAALLTTAKPTLMFLQHLSRIEVATRSKQYQVVRDSANGILTLSDDDGAEDWLVLRADFAEQAQALALRSGGLIDSERPSAVSLALPLREPIASGVLYATLPTQTPSGLPGHVNASFFPRTDRKSVKFESDLFSDWNWAGVSAVADALAVNAQTIVARVGIPAFWELIGAIDELADKAPDGAPNLAQKYLDQLRAVVPSLPVIETIQGELIMPAQALLPNIEDTYAATDALNRINLPVVTPGLRRRLHTNNLYRGFDIRLLTSSHVVNAISRAGLTEVLEPSSETLTTVQVEQILDLLNGFPGKVSNTTGIPDVTVVPCRNGKIAPPTSVIWPRNDDEAALFEILVDDLLVADTATIEEHCPDLQDVCTYLDASNATELLVEVDSEDLSQLSDDLMAWLEKHLDEIDDWTAQRLTDLKIFPTSAGDFAPLTSLSLPEKFDDPINVASLVEHRVARDYHRLLTRLGAKPLDVVQYFALHAIPAAARGEVPVEQAAPLLRIIGNHQVDLDLAKAQLASTPLIPGNDGTLHAADELHLPSDEINCLAPDLPVADTTAAPLLVLEWLGVRRVPGDQALAIAVRRLAEGEPDPGMRIAETVLHVLEEHERPGTATRPAPAPFLTENRWLPIKSGGRNLPAGVLPTNQRHLYGSQGNELGLPAHVQNRYFAQLTWLGMPSRPPVSVVITHLRASSDAGTEISPEVYGVLANATDNRSVRALRNFPSVHVGKGRYSLPQTVFWSKTPFGRWGTQLPEALRRFDDFFDTVGVKNEPGAEETAAVLSAIIDDFGPDPVDEEGAAAVHGCWELLSGLPRTAATDRVLDGLGHLRSLPDPRGVLERPDSLFFEDSRGLHRRFKLLSNNVIPRVQGTWPALERAGVHRVEDRMRAQLVGVPPVPDDQLPALIEDRLSAFQRVLADSHAVDILRSVTIECADDLTVTYRAELFGHSEEIAPEKTDAIYLRDRDTLVYDTEASARSLARELARAINPDEDPGRLAMQLQPVLDAASTQEAHSTLDDYGIGRLETDDHETAWSAPAELDIEGDDGDVALDGGEPFEHDEDLRPRPADEPVAAVARVDSTDDIVAEQAAEVRPEDASASDLDVELGATHGEVPATSGTGSDDASGSSERPVGVGLDSSSDGAAGPTAAGARPVSRRPTTRSRSSSGSGAQSRMRSYVSHDDDDDSRGRVGDEAPETTPVDRAGVARVLEYEESCGRRPVEKDHANPGFDVESFDRHGQLVRRIEIKSTGSHWSVRGVMLSRRQHEQAREDGRLFWLYVVENAEYEAEAKIYRIQDPTRFIDYFGFDDGWKALAEPDLDHDDSGSRVLTTTRDIFFNT